LLLLLVASISFFGIGMMTAVLPLISPEKGTQFGYVAQGLMLVVSGVYYPVSVLPHWLQYVAWALPPTYVFEGMRALLSDHVFRSDLMIDALARKSITRIGLGSGISSSGFA